MYERNAVTRQPFNNMHQEYILKRLPLSFPFIRRPYDIRSNKDPLHAHSKQMGLKAIVILIINTIITIITIIIVIIKKRGAL
jgi:hypothetical protein